MRDRIRQAMEDARKSDSVELRSEIQHINEVIKEASKVDKLLSEDGWKVLADLFQSIWKKAEIEIRRDENKRGEAIAMQNALAGLFNLISSIQGNRSAQEKRLACLVEQNKQAISNG